MTTASMINAPRTGLGSWEKRGARNRRVSRTVTPEVIELAPGEKARVTATIARANGFGGRVPLSVNNLPLLVTVPDIGLNGILITEDQTSRTFDVVADERAEPTEQTLYVTARVETNGGTASDHSSTPIRIRIVGRQTKRN